jgi:hypothetical protein
MRNYRAVRWGIMPVVFFLQNKGRRPTLITVLVWNGNSNIPVASEDVDCITITDDAAFCGT